MSAATATTIHLLPTTHRPDPSVLPRYAYRRGTRAFAALVIALAGSVVLAIGAVVLPSTSLDRLALSWLIPLAVAFGMAHLVAAYGLIARRRWAASLTGNLAAIGIGVASYGFLVTLTGLDPFAATSTLPRETARAEGLGLLVWMTGLWLVAVRFAIRATRPA